MTHRLEWSNNTKRCCIASLVWHVQKQDGCSVSWHVHIYKAFCILYSSSFPWISIPLTEFVMCCIITGFILCLYNIQIHWTPSWDISPCFSVSVFGIQLPQFWQSVTEMTIDRDMESTAMETSHILISTKVPYVCAFFFSWYCQAASVCNTSKSKQTPVSEVLLAKLVALGQVKDVLTFTTRIFVIVFEITTELCPQRTESSPHWHALILSVNIVICSCLRMFQFFRAVKLVWRKCFSNMTAQDHIQKINFFVYWENIFMTMSTLFKVIVFGDVTL